MCMGRVKNGVEGRKYEDSGRLVSMYTRAVAPRPPIVKALTDIHASYHSLDTA